MSRYTLSGLNHEVRRHFNSKSKGSKDAFCFAALTPRLGSLLLCFSGEELIHLAIVHQRCLSLYSSPDSDILVIDAARHVW